MSKFAIRGGHQYTGQDGAASGYVKEIDVDRRYYKLVMQKLKALGHEVLDVTPPEANRSLADSLNYGINMANNWGADYFISCHVDAFETDKAKGCEVVCGSQKGIDIGQRIVKEFNNLGFSTHRGAYIDDRGLAETRGFHGTTLICEPFFCDSSADVSIYNQVGDEGIANAIVKGITGQSVANPTPTKFYVVTNYLPQGQYGLELNGLWYKYFANLGIDRWYIKSNAKGLWIETQYMTQQNAQILADKLKVDGLLYQLVSE